MRDIKLQNTNLKDNWVLLVLLLIVITNAMIMKDSTIALISALCGITYTFLAGKGKPICYMFGITGSSFYCMLSFQSLLWGNLLLYALYYIPMQILGYFQWNKNLKECKKEIIKIALPKKELFILLGIIFILTIVVYYILIYFKDSHPLLDSITTVFSLGGMYLTVRRAIEQWLFWAVVNLLSLIMWINVLANGTKVYSTVFMWGIYLVLAIYFYITWKKELKSYLLAK